MGQYVRRDGGLWVGLRLGCVAGLAMLGACAVAPAPAAAPVAAAPVDPVLAAVAGAVPGDAVGAATPAGTVTVTVKSDYVSAAGHQCRGYTLTAPGGVPVARLACNDGTGWREIAPLAQAVNPGLAP